MHRALFLAPALLALLAGCAAQQGDYPSLAPRAIEQADGNVVERPAPVATPDAALDARIAELTGQLADAAAQFAPAADKARALLSAAQASGVGSADWLDAQIALAELDGYRARSTATLSALDELAIARARDLKPDYPALATARTQGEAQVQAENETIADLQKRLPGS